MKVEKMTPRKPNSVLPESPLFRFFCRAKTSPRIRQNECNQVQHCGGDEHAARNRKGGRSSVETQWRYAFLQIVDNDNDRMDGG